jgi:transcriptional regulator with XRE-family HTH domain
MPAHWKPVKAEHGRRGKFAEKLREVVRLRGMAPAEIAALAGVSRATVYAVLAGERLPTQELLHSIAGTTLQPATDRESKPLPRRLSPRVLAEQLDRLEREARRSAPPPAPPVRVGITPEQRAFAEALNKWVDEYRDEFPYYWPEDVMSYKRITRGWLQRFLEGRAVPSEVGLNGLIPDERPPSMAGKRWLQCQKDHRQLHQLAYEARRARRAAQAVARTLQGRR